MEAVAIPNSSHPSTRLTRAILPLTLSPSQPFLPPLRFPKARCRPSSWSLLKHNAAIGLTTVYISDESKENESLCLHSCIANYAPFPFSFSAVLFEPTQTELVSSFFSPSSFFLSLCFSVCPSVVFNGLLQLLRRTAFRCQATHRERSKCCWPGRQSRAGPSAPVILWPHFLAPQNGIQRNFL